MAGRITVVLKSPKRRVGWARLGGLACSVVLLGTCSAVADEPGVLLLPFESANWRYLDTGKPPADEWTEPDFDDSDWKEGTALLGYGDPDVRTEVSSGDNEAVKHPVTWIRRKLAIDAAGELVGLAARLICDDGAVVFVNGREVFRQNVANGIVEGPRWAESTTRDERRPWRFFFDKTLLVPGQNIIAVSVHQASSRSSDLAFDLELHALHNEQDRAAVARQVVKEKEELALREQQRAFARLRGQGDVVLQDGMVEQQISGQFVVQTQRVAMDAVVQAREQYGIEFFRVFAGDTIEKVAARTGHSVARLRLMNRKTEGHVFRRNDLVCLTWYFRTGGEASLTTVVAALYDTSSEVLKELNDLKSDWVPAATVLVVPGRFQYTPSGLAGPGELRLSDFVQDGGFGRQRKVLHEFERQVEVQEIRPNLQLIPRVEVQAVRPVIQTVPPALSPEPASEE